MTQPKGDCKPLAWLDELGRRLKDPKFREQLRGHPPTAPNGDSDRVAEIRQRLEAATGRRLAAAAIAHPNGADLRTADLAAHAPDDIAWLLSRLAVVEAERDELRGKVTAVMALIPRGVAS